MPLVRREKLILILVSVTLIASLLGYMLYSLPTPLTVKAHIIRASIGPIYKLLPDGRKVLVKVLVEYPDVVYFKGPGKGLALVNFTIYTNWTGWWDATVGAMIVDPNYHIDPTTFKPVEWMWAWGEGGQVAVAGTQLVCVEPPPGNNVSRSVLVWPRLRYFNSTPGEYNAQWFFNVRIVLCRPGGQVIEGGHVILYTNSSNILNVKVLVVKEQGRQLEALLVKNTLLALAAAAAIYLLAYLLTRLRAKLGKTSS